MELVASVIAWARGLLRRPQGLGDRGEAYAALYLKRQGMKLVARQRRKGKGEIDLIMRDGAWLVFVEVRTRASEAVMTPEGSVRFRKRRTVTRTVRRLMRGNAHAGLRPRIDLVAIVWPEGATQPAIVRHHKAVMPLNHW